MRNHRSNMEKKVAATLSKLTNWSFLVKLGKIRVVIDRVKAGYGYPMSISILKTFLSQSIMKRIYRLHANGHGWLSTMVKRNVSLKDKSNTRNWKNSLPYLHAYPVFNDPCPCKFWCKFLSESHPNLVKIIINIIFYFKHLLVSWCWM